MFVADSIFWGGSLVVLIILAIIVWAIFFRNKG